MNSASLERKKLFVEKSLWTCIEALWEATPKFEHNFQGKEDLVGRFLEAVKELGLATWEWDADGNLVCAPTPKLLNNIGTEPGPLEICGYIRTAPSPSNSREH